MPLSNRDLGFLPGDIDAKLDPYMQPIYDNLAAMQPANENANAMVRSRDFLQNNKVEVTPLAYIRGRSYLINRMVGQPIYGHVALEKGERSELAELASNLL